MTGQIPKGCQDRNLAIKPETIPKGYYVFRIGRNGRTNPEGMSGLNLAIKPEPNPEGML